MLLNFVTASNVEDLIRFLFVCSFFWFEVILLIGFAEVFEKLNELFDLDFKFGKISVERFVFLLFIRRVALKRFDSKKFFGKFISVFLDCFILFLKVVFLVTSFLFSIIVEAIPLFVVVWLCEIIVLKIIAEFVKLLFIEFFFEILVKFFRDVSIAVLLYFWVFILAETFVVSTVV